jgi:hypothetical protein
MAWRVCRQRVQCNSASWSEARASAGGHCDRIVLVQMVGGKVDVGGWIVVGRGLHG